LERRPGRGGQAGVDVLNLSGFGMQGFAPGNREYAYGTQLNPSAQG
jgi:hypothetical protein